MIIAIDGPSASGKGTLSKKLAAYFNLPYLNTGAIYRLIALRMIERKISSDLVKENLHLVAKNISEIDLENKKLFDEEVGALASVIAKDKKLRAEIFAFQNDFVARSNAEKKGCVLDGRDTTTVICPNADYKFFVTADVEIRAQRRFNQLSKEGKEVSYDEILSQLKQRDQNDFSRAESPLKIADDAFVVDNGNLSIEESFTKILQIILNRSKK